MSLLKVFHNGALIETLELSDGVEYYIGRAEENDVVLPKEKGISRKHLHIFQEDGEWAVALLSRFGNLTVEGEVVDSFIFENGVTFQVPPFSFKYEEPQSEPKTPEEPAPTKNQMVVAGNEGNEELELEGDSPGGMEVTAAGNNDLTAFLKVSYGGGAREILRLEGNFWVAGRDGNCEIVLNDSFMSRNHFEISRTNEGFYVRDLNARNTTHLNGQPLEPEKDARLSSGDEITIQSISILFEIHNDNYEELAVPSVNALVPNNPLGQGGVPSPLGPPQGGQMQPYGFNQSGMGGMVPYQPPGSPAVELINDNKSRDEAKKKKIRLVIMALIPLVIFGALMDDGKKDKNEGQKSSASSAQKKLNKEQLAFVKDSLILAQKHYVEHRYNLCLEQVGNIHNLIPSFQNSKELQSLCANQAELEKIKEEQNRMRAIQQKNEATIADVVEQCRLRMKQFKTLQQLQDCLSEAKVIDPLHEKITALEDVLRQKELVEQQKQQQQAAYQRSVRQGEALYRAAKSTASRKKWKQAIKQYEAYLNSRYPDPKNLKANARRELASVKGQFNSLISGSLKGCRSNFQTEAYKQSVTDCNKVLKVVPKHKEASKIKSDSLRALNKMMKIIYEDANMEESFGNTALASKKWKQILKEDVEGNLYHKKAKSKLKKLGVR